MPIFPSNGDRLFYANGTGPSTTLVWYHLQLPDDQDTLENVVSALVLLVNKNNWNAENQSGLDAFVDAFNVGVQTFELE